MSTYYRMTLSILNPQSSNTQLPFPPIAQTPPGIIILPYDPALHHDLIPQLYAESFNELPWPADWEAIPEFDPRGVFLGFSTVTASAVGFVVSFMRREFGYISVVAVIPSWRRQGIASALICAAAGYLVSRNPAYLRIDVEMTNLAAVRAYEKSGFKTEGTFEE